MKPLKLYKILPEGLAAMHVAARSNEQAAQIYATWEAAQELSGRDFAVEVVALENLDRAQRRQLNALLTNSTEGIARFDENTGWTIESDQWFSFDYDGPLLPGMIRIFQMRDMAEIEAFVLASDYERASALFEQHVRAHGGDPDAVMYREVGLEHLDAPANAAVLEALDLGREGLVSCKADGCWFCVLPLGAGLSENRIIGD